MIRDLWMVRKIRTCKIYVGLKRKIRDKHLKKRCAQMHEKGQEVLLLVNNIINNTGIILWIEWGTLLGYIREGKLIDHDYDLDFATWELEPNEYKRLSSSLKEKGFSLVRQFKNGDSIVSETYQYKGVLVDIDYCQRSGKKCVFYEYDIEKDTIIHKEGRTYRYEKLGVYIYSFPTFRVVKTQFQNGIECYIPENTDIQIVYRYGKDWRIPNPEHDWKDLNNYEYIGSVPRFTGWRKD